MPAAFPTLEALASTFGEELTKNSTLVAIGSHAEGFETSTSDIDLMAIGRAAACGNLTNGEYACKTVSGRRIQLGYLSVDGLRRHLQLPVTCSWDHCTLREAELIHKYASAKVLNGAELFVEVTADFDRTRLSQLIRFIETKFLTDLFDDIVGLLDANQLTTAALLCRELVNHAFDDLLAASGDTYCKPKWRVSRAVRIGAPVANALQAFLEFQLNGPGTSERAIADWMEEAILVSRRFQWEAMCAASGFSVPETMGNQTNEGSILCPIPFALLFERNSKRYVRTGKRLVELSPQAVQTFLAVHARTTENSLIGMLEQTSGISSAACKRALDGLVASGLIERYNTSSAVSSSVGVEVQG